MYKLSSNHLEQNYLRLGIKYLLAHSSIGLIFQIRLCLSCWCLRPCEHRTDLSRSETNNWQARRMVCGLVFLLCYRFVRVVDGEEGGHSCLCIDRGFNPWSISCSYCNMLSKMVVLFCEIILISYSSSVSGLPSVLCPRRRNSYLWA